MGYLQSSINATPITDGDAYLHTGDLGSVDKYGFVTIRDRIKEMIKVIHQNATVAVVCCMNIFH